MSRQFESGLVLRTERDYTASIDEADVVMRDDESFRALRGYQRETLYVIATLSSFWFSQNRNLSERG